MSPCRRPGTVDCRRAKSQARISRIADARSAPTMLLVTSRGPIVKSASALIETLTRPAPSIGTLPPHCVARDVPDRVHRGTNPEHHAHQGEDRARLQPAVQPQASAETKDHRYPQPAPKAD